MGGVSDLVDDVFAGILGEVQIQQDQARIGCIRIGAAPVDESESFAPAQQMDQFEWETLLLQRPVEKEDIRLVIIDHKHAGGWNNRRV